MQPPLRCVQALKLYVKMGLFSGASETLLQAHFWSPLGPLFGQPRIDFFLNLGSTFSSTLDDFLGAVLKPIFWYIFWDRSIDFPLEWHTFWCQNMGSVLATRNGSKSEFFRELFQHFQGSLLRLFRAGIGTIIWPLSPPPPSGFSV